jgi:hypothetical protein
MVAEVGQRMAAGYGEATEAPVSAASRQVLPVSVRQHYSEIEFAMLQLLMRRGLRVLNRASLRLGNPCAMLRITSGST